MFDFGFSELMVIGLIALVVLGPERLPRVARQAGQWMGKLQRYVSDVKSDINRQMELEELRNLQKEVGDAARDLKSSFESSVNEAQSELDSIARSVDSPSGSAPAATPQTDWDRIYAVRRTRDRIRDRRIEREKQLGGKRPKRRP